MLRFVDLRDQITDVEDEPIAFAFYDTIRDRFVDLVGTGVVYNSLADLESELERSETWGDQRDRFLGLLPPWVRGGPPAAPTPKEEVRKIVNELVDFAQTNDPYLWELNDRGYVDTLVGLLWDIRKRKVLDEVIDETRQAEAP